MFDKLAAIERRFIALEESLLQPNISGAALTKITKERSDIEELVNTYRTYSSLEKSHQDALALSQGDDIEMRNLAKEEMVSLEVEMENAKKHLLFLLLPKDPKDDKNAIFEIRAGTGGDEAGLFCADLLRMYTRYAEIKGWKVEVMSSTESTLGGFKEIILFIQGKQVFGQMKYESGGHRVQRVPATEAQGRIHTSACTVAVLPEVEEVEFEINPSDLRIDTYRASGSGGQHVNRTDSAVRITHIPTGTVSECQDERSQHKNKDRAMKMLRSRILDAMQRKQDSEISENRRSQVGSGDRSEKVRTYNFPQGRVTDHRINMTLYKLADFMNGHIEDMITALSAHYTALKLKENNLG